MISFEAGLRITECLLALAFLQQSAEHVFGSKAAKWHFVIRAALSLCLICAIQTPFVLLALTLHSVALLHRFQGPYNGGSDRMGLLILYCITLAHWLPAGIGQEAAFGYLAIQVILSYYMAGYVKLKNPDWRSGQALRDVFHFSAYPVSTALRGLAHQPRRLWAASWAVMLFEVAFPISLISAPTLIIFLIIGFCFHVANAVCFGLNRFVWAWAASYPAIIWLQGRVALAL